MREDFPMRLPLDDLDVWLNADMQPVYSRVELDLANSSLPDELRSYAAQGVTVLEDRVYLVAYPVDKHPVPEQLANGPGGRWSLERWVNKLFLNSSRPPSDALWRIELAGWAVAAALMVLTDASDQRCPFTLQACVGLQSPEGRADPELDFATGAVHFTTVQEPDDDIRALSVKPYEGPIIEQPLLVLTLDGQQA